MIAILKNNRNTQLLNIDLKFKIDFPRFRSWGCGMLNFCFYYGDRLG